MDESQIEYYASEEIDATNGFLLEDLQLVLEPIEYQIIIYKYFHGLTIDKIADSLAIPRSKVKRKLQSASAKTKKYYKKEYMK